jgi:hypothetical protein
MFTDPTIWRLFFGLGGLALGAWGTITLIYTRVWPHAPFNLAASWAARWIGALALAVAIAAALITKTGMQPVGALAIGLAASIGAGIALGILPANVLAP